MTPAVALGACLATQYRLSESDLFQNDRNVAIVLRAEPGYRVTEIRLVNNLGFSPVAAHWRGGRLFIYAGGQAQRVLPAVRVVRVWQTLDDWQSGDVYAKVLACPVAR